MDRLNNALLHRRNTVWRFPPLVEPATPVLRLSGDTASKLNR